MRHVILKYNDIIFGRIHRAQEDIEYQKSRLKKPCQLCMYEGHVYRVGACADTQCGQDNCYQGFIPKEAESYLNNEEEK